MAKSTLNTSLLYLDNCFWNHVCLHLQPIFPEIVSEPHLVISSDPSMIECKLFCIRITKSCPKYLICQAVFLDDNKLVICLYYRDHALAYFLQNTSLVKSMVELSCQKKNKYMTSSRQAIQFWWYGRLTSSFPGYHSLYYWILAGSHVIQF